MGGFAVALGILASAAFAETEGGKERPTIHLVLADGHGQLRGQSKRVVEVVADIFKEMCIDVTSSTDPSAPFLGAHSVTVVVLPRSSRDWRVSKGALATVLRDNSDSPGSVFLFYPDIKRAMSLRPTRAKSIVNERPAGVSWNIGIARVITHEILHYFLPGRPHDKDGIFMEHLRGDVLLRQNLRVASETQSALLAKLRARTE